LNGALLAEGSSVDTSLIGSILQNAGVGTAIIVVLVLVGVLDPARYTKAAEADRDKWHAAYEKLREEGEELRRALAAQTARGDAANETAQRLTDVVERLQVKGDAPLPETPAPFRRRGSREGGHGS
jgi:hypothetical protein